MGDTNHLELAGMKVNFLTVIERTDFRRGSSVMWKCHCVCGGHALVRANILKAGRIKSCGCQTNRILSKARSTHGLSKIEAKTFRIWRGMRERCEKKYHKSYHYYGARGIAVCDRWKDFGCFFADMGRVPDGMSLDRINNDGNYEPSNCRWATAKTQANNRRNSRFLECGGRRMTLQEWSDVSGIPYDTINLRLKRGWSVERAVSKPVREMKNWRKPTERMESENRYGEPIRPARYIYRGM